MNKKAEDAFRQFRAELAQLHDASERARRAEKRDALARIKAMLDEYAIGPDELRRLLAAKPPEVDQETGRGDPDDADR